MACMCGQRWKSWRYGAKEGECQYGKLNCEAKAGKQMWPRIWVRGGKIMTSMHDQRWVLSGQGQRRLMVGQDVGQ